MQKIDNYRFLEELKRYRAGAVLDFGAIQISRQGVSFRNQHLPWVQIKEIVLDLDLDTKSKVSTPYVSIRSKEDNPLSGALIPMQAVKNVSLLMALVGEILKHPEQA